MRMSLEDTCFVLKVHHPNILVSFHWGKEFNLYNINV